MRIIPISLCLAFATCSFGQTPETTRYENLPGVALYSNGYLLSWDSPNYTEVTVYGRDSRRMYSKPQHKDDVFHNNAWAIDSDGVTAGVYTQRDPWKGRLDLLDASGNVKRSVDTGSYIGQHVVFAPDHTLWTVGFIAGNDGSKEDFNVLHHYARSGEELGQALHWSQIAGNQNTYTALQLFHGGRQLHASNDRIGFVSRSDDGTNSNTWIEVSFSGDLLGIYGLGSNVGESSYFPVAMTADGGVYATVYEDKQFDGWATLDRSERTWRKVSGFPEGKLIGSEGKKLIFARRNETETILQSVLPSSFRLENTRQEALLLP
jgi:hypothetical protein